MPANEMHSCDIRTLPADLCWPAMTEVKPPEPGVVQLWCALLQSKPTRLHQLGQCLPRDETERASRFRTPTLRERFLVSRVVLRRVLGQCLGVAPEEMRFQTDAKGKPRLAGSYGFEFNLAHTADLMLLAVGRNLPVGVDVERVRPLKDGLAIANRFFTKREADWLRRRKPGQPDRAFFDLWTRKEAVLKATGAGVSGGLASLELLKADGAFQETVTGAAEGSSHAVWAVTALEPATGFVGALAYPASAGRIALQKATFQPA